MAVFKIGDRVALKSKVPCYGTVIEILPPPLDHIVVHFDGAYLPSSVPPDLLRPMGETGETPSVGPFLSDEPK